MWYIIIYLAITAFLYGFLWKSSKSDPTTWDSDAALMFAIFWPIMIPMFIFAIIIVFMACFMLLCILPFEFIGYMAYLCIMAIVNVLKSKTQDNR